MYLYAFVWWLKMNIAACIVIILSKLFLFTYYYNDRNYSMRNFAADIFVGSSYRDFMDESCLANPNPSSSYQFWGTTPS